MEGLQPAQAQVERFQRLQRVALAHLDAAALGGEGAGPASGVAVVASPDDVDIGADTFGNSLALARSGRQGDATTSGYGALAMSCAHDAHALLSNQLEFEALAINSTASKSANLQLLQYQISISKCLQTADDMDDFHKASSEVRWRFKRF